MIELFKRLSMLRSIAVVWILGFLLGSPYAGGAASVRLIWLPNDPTENVTNYNIYYWEQTQAGNPADHSAAPVLLKHVAGLATVTNILGTDYLTTVIDSAALVVDRYYRFFATADNAAGESDPSLYAPPSAQPPYRLQAPAGGGNQPPTIQLGSSAVMVPLEVGARVPIPFTVGDAETPVAGLGVQVASLNTAVIPTPALQVTGTAPNLSLGILGLANTSGTATVRITVTDGGNATASRDLAVTINAPPRVVGLPAGRVRIVNSTVLSFTVADEDDPAAAITGTATSNNSGALANGEMVLKLASGQGDVNVPRTDAQWQLELNLPESERRGLADVTLTFTDSKGTAVGTYLLELDKTSEGLLSLPPQASPGDLTVTYQFRAGAGLVGPVSIRIVSTSNETLAPFLNIFPGTPSVEPTITVRPVPGQQGTSIITFVATDGVKTQTYAFEMVVDAPTITPIPDIAARAGTLAATPAFRVRDVATPASSIRVTARSLDPAVLPSGHIVVVGSEADRQVVLDIPRAAAGTVPVELQAVDGEGWVSYQYFQVQIQAAVNDPPSVAIAGVPADGEFLIREGQTLGPLAISVGDAETPVEALRLTVATPSDAVLFPFEGIQLGGSGWNRSLVASPRAGLYGSAEIAVSVTDAEGASSTAIVRVRVLPRPGADFDRDGLADLVFQNSSTLALKVRRSWLSLTGGHEDFPRGLGAIAVPGALRAIADVNADGGTDILFQRGDGRVVIWGLGGNDGLDWLGEIALASSPAAAAVDRLVAVADMDRDGLPDLIFQTPALDVYTWAMTGSAPPLDGVRRPLVALSAMLQVDQNRIAGSGDADGDGQPDLFYQGLDEDGKHGAYLFGLGDLERVVRRAAVPQQIPLQFGRGWRLTSVNDYHWQLPEVYEASGAESWLTRLTPLAKIQAFPDLMFQVETGSLFLWYQNGLPSMIHNQMNGMSPGREWRLVPTR